MQTATEIHALIDRVYDEGRVELSGLSWEEYDALLKEIDDRYIFVSYNRGECEITAPSERHDDGKTLVARMIEAMAYELRIPMRCLGSTTWRRPDLEVGIEPDECYFIQSYQRVKGHEVNLLVDPPPDLAVEVDISRSTKKREPIYAALGVPELWRIKKGRITFCKLRSGKYSPIETSLAFPRLKSDDMNRYFELWRNADDLEGQDAFREWVRETLKPNS